MKHLQFIPAYLALVISTPGHAAGWIADKVSHVEVSYGTGCIMLDNGEAVEVDLESGAGRTQFSMAMTARVQDKKLSVFQADGYIKSPCSPDGRARPHISLRLAE